jgi:hypothetical protein
MNRKEHLLIILNEECTEVAKEVCKSLRFGLEDIMPGQDKTNSHRISLEVADLLGILEMLYEEMHLSRPRPEDIEAKKNRVEAYLKYSKKVGTLQDGHKYY